MSNLKCVRETLTTSEWDALWKISERLYEAGWFVLDTQWMKNPRLALYVAPVFKRGEQTEHDSMGFVKVDLDGNFPTIYMPIKNTNLLIETV